MFICFFLVPLLLRVFPGLDYGDRVSSVSDYTTRATPADSIIFSPFAFEQELLFGNHKARPLIDVEAGQWNWCTRVLLLVFSVRVLQGN